MIRRGRPVALLLGLALVVGACPGDPKPQQAPGAAADQVAALLLLDDRAAACLTSAFDADPALAAIVNAGEGEQLPTSRTQEALAAVRGCASADELAAGLARLTAVSASADEAAEACIRDEVAALPGADRDLLVLWAVNATALDNAGDLRLAEVAGDLATTCGIAVPMATSDGGTPSLPSDGGDPTVSIGESGATATR